jgi:hypothetical protein
MTSAIWGILAGMALMFGASMYLRELRLLHRPDRRWTGKKRWFAHILEKGGFMSLVPTQRRSPSPLRQADSPAAVRDRRTELGRADEARAEQRERDDARNDPNASKWRYQPPQRNEKEPA